LDVLGQGVERRIGLAGIGQGLGLQQLDAGLGATQVLQLRQGLAQLDRLQVAVQRLLVQPMWGATQLLGCRFEPVSHQFVNFDADGGGGHIRVAPWKNLCTLFVKWRDSRKVQPSQILGFTCLCFGATESLEGVNCRKRARWCWYRRPFKK